MEGAHGGSVGTNTVSKRPTQGKPVQTASSPTPIPTLFNALHSINFFPLSIPPPHSADHNFTALSAPSMRMRLSYLQAIGTHGCEVEGTRREFWEKIFPTS